MVLLDWEKAFDKIDRGTLFEALERMSLHPKIINIIKSIYKDRWDEAVQDAHFYLQPYRAVNANALSL